MQPTRQLILQYLKENGQATVEELAKVLDLTPVTVRHHLDILRGEELVSDPIIRHRASPGRPQYAFALTDKASAHFPKNYAALAGVLLDEVKQLAPQTVNVIFEGMAQRLSAEAPRPNANASWPRRLDQAVAYLNRQGYVAHWENTAEGYVLHTCNCPYEAVSAPHPELCQLDMTLVGNLLGMLPQRASRVAEGASSCAYFIPRV
jgi:predicted ArsR family transcriptional regulator